MGSHLRKRARLLVVAGVMVLATAGCLRPPVAPAASGCAGPGGPPDALTATVFARTNVDRAANGLGPLGWNPRLWCLGSDWSNHLAATGAFAHRNLAVVLRSRAYGSYRTLGENIAHGPGGMTGDALQDAWMASPEHVANILSRAYSSIGIASTVAADGSVYVTANFAG